MWIRYNPALKYYEYSNNNGSTWAQLPMSAASITEGSIPLPPNVAYTNINNNFSVDQSIVSSDPILYLVDTAQAAGYRHFRLINSEQNLYIQATDEVGSSVAYLRMSRGGQFVVGDRLSVGTQLAPPNSGDLVIARNNNSNSGALYFGSNPAGGAYLFRATDGNYVLAGGAFTVNGTINVGGNIFTTNGYIYPAPVTSPGVGQGSWYLGSHSSYGLYSNTGLYLVSNVWCESAVASNYVVAGLGVRDYNRSTPIGVWITHSPSITPNAGTLSTGALTCQYMFVGKTMFFRLMMTSWGHSGGATEFLVSLPFSIASGGTYQVANACNWYNAGTGNWDVGMIFGYAGESVIRINRTGTAAFPATAGSLHIWASIAVPIP